MTAEVKARLRDMMRASRRDEQSFDALLAAYACIETLEVIVHRLRVELKSARAINRNREATPHGP